MPVRRHTLDPAAMRHAAHAIDAQGLGMPTQESDRRSPLYHLTRQEVADERLGPLDDAVAKRLAERADWRLRVGIAAVLAYIVGLATALAMLVATS